MPEPADLRVVGEGDPRAKLLAFLDTVRKRIEEGEDLRGAIVILDSPRSSTEFYVNCTLSERNLLLDQAKLRWLLEYQYDERNSAS